MALMVAAAPLAFGQMAPKKDQAKQNADVMTFSDQPNFVVSGVTDWTAVGGHGSDATLRTSEDLARVTLSLKTPGLTTANADAAAETRLNANVTAHPQSNSANSAMGEYYLQQGHYRQALPFLQTASVLTHGEAAAEYDLALACRGLKDLPQARLHVQQALTKTDNAEYHQLAGLLAEDLGDPYTAVQQLQRAVQLSPSESNYFAWASELLLHRAVWQAIEVFRHGVTAYPASARMKTGLGSALFAGGRYGEAADQLCSASDLRPDEAETYLLLGRIDEATPTPLPCVPDRLARFLQLQPGNAAAHYLYAMALFRREGDSSLDRTHALLTQAIFADPNYAAAYLQLGILAAQQRQYPQAIDFYKKALAIDEVLPEAHYRLAVAYDHTHQTAEAKHERELHEALKRQQADAVEQQRRSVKQFTMSQDANPQSRAN